MQFEIKQGKSTSLIDANGNCILPAEHKLNGCWYLTTDTAEVYVGFLREDNSFELRKINDCDIENEFKFQEFDSRISTLETQERIHTYGYRSNFPSIEDARDNDLYVAVDEKKTYVFYNKEYVVVSGTEETSPDIIYGGSAEA